MEKSERPNLDVATVRGFGKEWSSFDQTGVQEPELQSLFEQYFSVFPKERLTSDAVGFDLGCGSGRWARYVAPQVGRLHCIDASAEALTVAKRALRDLSNCEFHLASVDKIPLADESMDFGYSLGVLHHVPDTQAGISACVRVLKPGAPLLLYLYYDFENRGATFRTMWRMTDLARRGVARLPFALKKIVTSLIAATIYLPLARLARAGARLGLNVQAWPLSYYRDRSFYTMRTDALDRFGTRLEKRFSKQEIRHMMTRAALERVTFSEAMPFWCVVGFKPSR